MRETGLLPSVFIIECYKYLLKRCPHVTGFLFKYENNVYLIFNLTTEGIDRNKRFFFSLSYIII